MRESLWAIWVKEAMLYIGNEGHIVQALVLQ